MPDDIGMITLPALMARLLSSGLREWAESIVIEGVVLLRSRAQATTVVTPAYWSEGKSSFCPISGCDRAIHFQEETGESEGRPSECGLLRLDPPSLFARPLPLSFEPNGEARSFVPAEEAR